MGRGEEDYARRHRNKIDEVAYMVYQLYLQAAKRAISLGYSTKHNSEKTPFSFSNYPSLRPQVNNIFAKLATDVVKVITASINEEWLLADQKNDDLVKRLFTESMPVALSRRFLGRNLEALHAFQAQKIEGMTISEKVWNYTSPFKSEMEMAIDQGLLEGRSAAQLSQDIRQYLKDPDKLFRRVRNSRGALHLSKAAENYHPGQGRYRSSFRNAERLTRTLINDSYRESDHQRWQQLDFVVGIEVRRSNNPYPCPVCDALKGRYPKSYKFRSVHPSCRCYAISILATKEEMDRLTEMILNDEDTSYFRSINEVTRMPDGWVEWMAKNRERLLTARSLPFFIKDNFRDGDFKKGLKIRVNESPEIPIRKPSTLQRYEQSLRIKVNDDIFQYFTKESVSFQITKKPGAYYDTTSKSVNIPIDDRRKSSKWKAESVVYHEFGHALDWQHDLRNHPKVSALMDKYRARYEKNKNELYAKLIEEVDKIGWDAADTGKNDTMEQAGAFADTIMSLNSNFGSGHSKQYFAQKGMPEAEFLAHAFENKYAGNPVFEKLAKDLYNDSIKLINQLLKELK